MCPADRSERQQRCQLLDLHHHPHQAAVLFGRGTTIEIPCLQVNCATQQYCCVDLLQRLQLLCSSGPHFSWRFSCCALAMVKQGGILSGCLLATLSAAALFAAARANAGECEGSASLPTVSPASPTGNMLFLSEWQCRSRRQLHGPQPSSTLAPACTGGIVPAYCAKHPSFRQLSHRHFLPTPQTSRELLDTSLTAHVRSTQCARGSGHVSVLPM